MKARLLVLIAAATIVAGVLASTANSVSYNTGWVCQYLSHPAPVPYGNGYLFCIGDYRWHFVGP